MDKFKAILDGAPRITEYSPRWKFQDAEDAIRKVYQLVHANPWLRKTAMYQEGYIGLKQNVEDARRFLS